MAAADVLLYVWQDGWRPGKRMQNLVASSVTRAQVLIVDDCADLCELISEMLEISGYTTASAHDGAQALRLLRAGLGPKMILLDRAIPVLDGPHFLDGAAGLLGDTRIVWMTADEEVIDHPAVVGMLKKPFDLDDLLRMVRAHVGGGEPPENSKLAS
jgi:two-component system response regulator MprA